VAGFDSNSDWIKYRTHLLVPYLDFETLTKNSATLFGLIHARVSSLPEDWALYDSEQLRSAWAWAHSRLHSMGVLYLCMAITMGLLHNGSETQLIVAMLSGFHEPVLSLRLRPFSCDSSTDRLNNCPKK
jgi:hypothetical protein